MVLFALRCNKQSVTEGVWKLAICGTRRVTEGLIWPWGWTWVHHGGHAGVLPCLCIMWVYFALRLCLFSICQMYGGEFYLSAKQFVVKCNHFSETTLISSIKTIHTWGFIQTVKNVFTGLFYEKKKHFVTTVHLVSHTGKITLYLRWSCTFFTIWKC